MMPEELIFFFNSLPTEEFTDVAECRTQIDFCRLPLIAFGLISVTL